MTCSQWSACLVVFLVAVGVHGSYGENGLGENCTSNSDCDYSHGRCVKYDQCDMGLCGCDYGYKVSGNIGGSYVCLKGIKIGDRCDVIKDKCYDGTCLGVCTCGNQKHASPDRKRCVGNLYGQPCSTKSFHNSNWKEDICEPSEHLRCDADTSKCVCSYGMKTSDNRCEYYKIGETCKHLAIRDSDLKRCEEHLSCDDYTKKCVCQSSTKEHTFMVLEDGFEVEKKRCVDTKATLNVAESATCTADYDRRYTMDAVSICGNYHLCSVCVEWANDYGNNTKCLSGGADNFRSNTVASLGLVLVAFVATWH